MSPRLSPSLRQQKRRWLTTIGIATTLLIASLAFTLATIPSQPLRIQWGRPTALHIPRVPGSDDEILLNAISCTSGTACSAGGFVSTTKTTVAIVVNESNGRWQTAQVIKGSATAGVGDDASIKALSCSSPGNCSAGGSFIDGQGLSSSALLGAQGPPTAFIANEVHGKWSGAQPVTGVVAPGIQEGATISYLSCASNGNCAAAGSFASVPCADGDNNCVLQGATYKHQFEKSFVVNEVNGVWGLPEWLRGASRGEYPNLNGLSCAANTCVAVGTSLSPSGEQEGFVADETDGRWSSSVLFPGLDLAGQTSSTLSAVSCGSRGNCSAGGSYTDKVGHTHPFVVDEISGTWQRAATVKGATKPALDTYTQIQSISCGSSNDCTAFGESLGPAGQGLYYFVLTKHRSTWSSVRLVPGSASLTFDGYSGSEMACSTGEICTIAGSYYTIDDATRPYALSEEGRRFTRLVSLRGIPRLYLLPTEGSIVTLSCGARDNCIIVEVFATMEYEKSFFIQESLK
jgi:hypothetical protein